MAELVTCLSPVTLQGLVISIIFGLANEEVQNVVRSHWRRRMMVRMVKMEGEGRQRLASMRLSAHEEVVKDIECDNSASTQLTVA